jgi:hypothetical protein
MRFSFSTSDSQHAHLEASLKHLPFYLVTQFGRHRVAQEAEALIAESGSSQGVKDAAGAIRYWMKYPAGMLVGHLASLAPIKNPDAS